MTKIKFYSGKEIPLEMHRTRVVQKLNLRPIDERAKALETAGNNLYLLHNDDIFLDMLTDSGVNAMSDKQLARMMDADDAYAGSTTYFELEDKIKEIFGFDYFLPVHQGRAAENILACTYVKEGDVVPMNYHFTTTKAHIVANGGTVVEVLDPKGYITASEDLFKGDFNLDHLRQVIEEAGPDHVPFIRIEAGTNLIGGQPISLQNMKNVIAIAQEYGIMTVLDASLLQDNLYFIKTREDAYKDASIREITREISDLFDIVYFSARKLGFARGGGICCRTKEIWDEMKELLTLVGGFLTYGGMSIKEIGAITQGLEETMDFDVISQGPMFIDYMANRLAESGVPVVLPGGGLGCHVDAADFVPQVKGEEYPSAALCAALYLVAGIRTMERGTLSEDRNPDGSEHIAEMELMRCALPRRVFTLSQVEYAVDRIAWLYEHRDLIGGLRFTEEPKTLRFFVGRLEPVSDWQEKLVAAFKQDFPEDN